MFHISHESSNKQYKSAFVDFITALQWHWFLTIGVGDCPNDDELLRRLRHIENQLCRRYLVNKYYKLPHQKRYSLAVAFEGERDCGSRHAHVLAYVPIPTKKQVTHDVAINLFQWQFRSAWMELKYKALQQIKRHLSVDWTAADLRFGRANIARTIYGIKDVRKNEIPWSRFEFVTLPKTEKFTNENLSVIRNRDRQRRKILAQCGDHQLAKHVA
jgi:hypothetical protein